MEESTLGPLMDPSTPEYKAYWGGMKNKRTAGIVATIFTPILVTIGIMNRKKKFGNVFFILGVIPVVIYLILVFSHFSRDDN